MDYLAFLNRLMEHKLALNPARVLLYIDANPGCKQCDMFGPLNMSRAVLSQCCNLLINKEMIYQEGSYISKTHEMRRKGKELLTKIKNEQHS
jgi:hypothetical protein